VDTVPVKLFRMHVRDVTVPHLDRVVREGDAESFIGIVRRIEQTEFDLGGVFGEQGEVYPCPVPGRPEWVRPAGPDAHESISGRVS
jgi:hypothetical protein